MNPTKERMPASLREAATGHALRVLEALIYHIEDGGSDGDLKCNYLLAGFFEEYHSLYKRKAKELYQRTAGLVNEFLTMQQKS
jgi:hypothetical protein